MDLFGAPDPKLQPTNKHNKIWCSDMCLEPQQQKSQNRRMTAETVLLSPQDTHKPMLVYTHKHTHAHKSINQSINGVWNLLAFFVSTTPKSVLPHQSSPIPELSWADSLLVAGSFISSLRSPNNGLLFQFIWFAGIPVCPTFCLERCALL